jgi:sec-independent protein translocase protein TatB
MFDFGIGYTELLVVAVVAIIVVGPKDLPRVLRAIGRMTAKMRGMAREFQGHLDSAMRETGFDEVKKDLQSIRNPVAGLKEDLSASFKKQDETVKALLNETPKPKSDEAPKPAVPAVAGNDFDKFFGDPGAPKS